MEDMRALYDACADLLQAESRKKMMMVPAVLLPASVRCTDVSDLASLQPLPTGSQRGTSDLHLLKFPHPATDTCAVWAFDVFRGETYQLFQLSEKHSSWFIGNYVLEDGSFCSLIPVDPLFLIIPFLLKSKQKRLFQSVNHMLADCSVTSPDYHRAIELLTKHEDVFLKDLDLICTVKNVGGNRFVKLCKRKLVAWIKAKVRYVGSSLRRERVDVGTKTVSAGYTSVKSVVAYPQESYNKYAMGILGDYLPSSLRLDITQCLGLEETVSFKEHSGAQQKRKVGEICEAAEDYSKNMTVVSKATAKKLTTTQKQLQKVDKSGMKSLTSYFTRSKSSDKIGKS